MLVKHVFTTISFSCALMGASMAYAQMNNEQIAAHCSAPVGEFVAHINGLDGLDTYVSSRSLGFTSGYATNPELWFGNGARLTLDQNSASALNDDIKKACAAIISRNASQLDYDTVEIGILTDRLWWPVTGGDYEGRPTLGYVSARYVAFTPRQEWTHLFGFGLGSTATNHSAGNRIVEITGADTQNARFFADRVARNVVSYCHVGHGLSALYQDARDGVIDEQRVNDGIWAGCNEYAETPEFVERQANCATREFLGGTVVAADLLLAGSGAGAVMGDFITLCPQTSKRMVREACAAGDQFMCDYAARERLSSVCATDETVVFSCRIIERAQSVSICRKNDLLSYVYGEDPQNPELRISRPVVNDADLAAPYDFVNGSYLYRVTPGYYGDAFSGLELFEHGEFVQQIFCAQ